MAVTDQKEAYEKIVIDTENFCKEIKELFLKKSLREGEQYPRCIHDLSIREANLMGEFLKLNRIETCKKKDQRMEHCGESVYYYMIPDGDGYKPHLLTREYIEEIKKDAERLKLILENRR